MTRVTVVWLLAGRHDWVQGDLDYFASALASALPVILSVEAAYARVALTAWAVRWCQSGRPTALFAS